MFYVILAILAGAVVSAQSSINGLMYPYVGPMGVVFLGNIIGIVFLILYSLIKERKMISLKGLPFYLYGGGILAVFVLGFSGYCVTVLGSAVTVCLSVAGQIIMSALVDHFGLFGTRRIPFVRKRIPGFLLILAGIAVINLGGGSDTAGVSGAAMLPMLLFAIIIGMVTVVIRLVNYKSSSYVGSVGGGMVNFISGTILAFLVLLVSSGFSPEWGKFAEIPVVYYTAGILGALSILMNVAVYAKMEIFYSTILMLIGQIGTGILMDVFIFGTLSVVKCLGIAVVCTGIFLDKKLTLQKQPEADQG